MEGGGVRWGRTPGVGRYAHPERERRFLLRAEPTGIASTAEISDVYLDGLRLRLREVRSGGTVAFKLTQKVRPDPASPAEVLITNVYLSADEHRVLRALPGAALRKTRSLCRYDGAVFAVDVFHGPLTGLRLAEVEVADLSAPLALPPWLGAEVTADDRFSGGALARASAADVAALLARST